MWEIHIEKSHNVTERFQTYELYHSTIQNVSVSYIQTTILLAQPAQNITYKLDGHEILYLKKNIFNSVSVVSWYLLFYPFSLDSIISSKHEDVYPFYYMFIYICYYHARMNPIFVFCFRILFYLLRIVASNNAHENLTK